VQALAITARERTDAMGRALRSEAINVGRGYPGQVAQSYGLAQQAGREQGEHGVRQRRVRREHHGHPVQWGSLGAQALERVGQYARYRLRRADEAVHR
jgi:hypothetical protein